MTVDFLQRSHELKLDFSTRDGMNLLRFAMKRLAQDTDHPLGKDSAWAGEWGRGLGEDAVDLESLAQGGSRTLGGDAVPLGLGDFFFSPEDPLHPDLDDEEDDEDDIVF